MAKKQIGIDIVVLLLFLLSACSPGIQAMRSTGDTSALSGEGSSMESVEQWQPTQPTREELEAFQKDITHKFSLLERDPAAIQEVCLSVYNRASNESIAYSCSDPDIIADWLSFFDTLELTYEAFNPAYGTPFDQLTFIVNDTEIYMGSAWNIGSIYMKGDNPVMAKISNFNELQTGYYRLREQMGVPANR